MPAPDDDVDAERLQIQDFAWDVASLRHRWEQAQSGVAEAIEQQGRVLASVVLPQSAGSGLFSAAGVGAGFAIGSSLFGGPSGAFDPSDVDVDLPPIPTSLSEEERRRYREENPQALEDLMDVDLDELDDETRQQVESAIIRLAVPDVDSSDGEADAETVEEALSDEDMADEMTEAFGRSTEVGDGLDSLEDWAASNEVDLEESEAVAGAMGYLGAFHRATYARRDEVEKYLEDGVRTGGLWPFTEEYEQAADEEQLETIRQGWADGLLALSREDYGGGWDELPEGMREAAQHPDGAVDFDAFRELMPLLEHADSGRSPGDDLATNLAMAAEYVLHVENARADSAAGADPGVPESALTTALGLAGRNESASAALLAGSGDVDGFDGAELPDSFDSSRFVANVFDKDWEDDGAAVAGLIDWIGSEDGLPGPAEDAWYGLMETLTSVGDGGRSPDVFGQLMGDASSGALDRNDALAESFARTVAANLDEIALAGGSPSGALDDEHHVRIMTLASSNDAAVKYLSAEVQLYQADLVGSFIEHGEDGPSVADKLAILQSKFEGGVHAEARYSNLSNDKADSRVINIVQEGSEILSASSNHPGVALGDYIIDNIDLDEPIDNERGFQDGVSPQYRLRLFQARARIWMLEGLGGEGLSGVESYVGGDADLPDRLVRNLDDELEEQVEAGRGLTSDQLLSPYHQTAVDDLGSHIEQHRPDADDGRVDGILDDFSDMYLNGVMEYQKEGFHESLFGRSLSEE